MKNARIERWTVWEETEQHFGYHTNDGTAAFALDIDVLKLVARQDILAVIIERRPNATGDGCDHMRVRFTCVRQQSTILTEQSTRKSENLRSAMIAHKYSQSCRNTSSVGLIQYLCQGLGLQHCIFREPNAFNQFQNGTFKIDSTTKEFVQAIWQFSRVKPSSSSVNFL